MYQLTITDRKAGVSTSEFFSLRKDAQAAFLREFRKSEYPNQPERSVINAFKLWHMIGSKFRFQIEAVNARFTLQVGEIKL